MHSYLVNALPPPVERLLYTWNTRVSVPSSESGLPPPIWEASVTLPPWTQRGRSNTLLQVNGWGTQFGRLDRKPGTLYTLHVPLSQLTQWRMLLMKSPFHLLKFTFYGQWGTRFQTRFLFGSRPGDIFLNFYEDQESIPRNRFRKPEFLNFLSSRESISRNQFRQAV